MSAVIAVILMLVALFVSVLSLWVVRRQLRPLRKEPEGLTCRGCGYSLEQTGIPRCPECGSLLGFDQTAEEMGIEPEEMRF